MLVVTVELWPGGDESKARAMGVATIANDGAGTLESGDYVIRLLKSKGGLWRKGEVKGFPRKRLGPWDLLLRGLVETVGDRNLTDGQRLELSAPIDSVGGTQGDLFGGGNAMDAIKGR